MKRFLLASDGHSVVDAYNSELREYRLVMMTLTLSPDSKKLQGAEEFSGSVTIPRSVPLHLYGKKLRVALEWPERYGHLTLLCVVGPGGTIYS